MATLGRKVILIALDMSQPGTFQILDQATQLPPVLYAGEDWQINVGLFQNFLLGTLYSIANLSLMQFDLKSPGNITGVSAITKTVASGGLSDAVTLATFLAGTAANAMFTCTNSDTNFSISAAEQYTMVLSGLTSDSPGRIIGYATFPAAINPMGLNAGGSPPPATPTFYTAAQSDARYPIPGAPITSGGPTATLPNCPGDNPSAPSWIPMNINGTTYVVVGYLKT